MSTASPKPTLVNFTTWQIQLLVLLSAPSENGYGWLIDELKQTAPATAPRKTKLEIVEQESDPGILNAEVMADVNPDSLELCC